jgi:hypothetical protein
MGVGEHRATICWMQVPAEGNVAHQCAGSHRSATAAHKHDRSTPECRKPLTAPRNRHDTDGIPANNQFS